MGGGRRAFASRYCTCSTLLDPLLHYRFRLDSQLLPGGRFQLPRAGTRDAAAAHFRRRLHEAPEARRCPRQRVEAPHSEGGLAKHHSSDKLVFGRWLADVRFGSVRSNLEGRARVSRLAPDLEDRSRCCRTTDGDVARSVGSSAKWETRCVQHVRLRPSRHARPMPRVWITCCGAYLTNQWTKPILTVCRPSPSTSIKRRRRSPN